MAYTYRGFSTVGRSRKYRLTDFDLIRQDIINHFYIRKGEKLMRPNFGTIIWNVLHEPFTEELKNVIVNDVKTIANYDPRVAVDNIVITEFERGIQIELDLRFLQTDQTETLNLQFDNEIESLSVL